MGHSKWVLTPCSRVSDHLNKISGLINFKYLVTHIKIKEHPLFKKKINKTKHTWLISSIICHFFSHCKMFSIYFSVLFLLSLMRMFAGSDCSTGFLIPEQFLWIIYDLVSLCFTIMSTLYEVHRLQRFHFEIIAVLLSYFLTTCKAYCLPLVHFL